MENHENGRFSFEAAGKRFGRKKTLVIAEIGTSHGGSLKKAEELVAAAAEAGADCAKFQMVFADEILHPLSGLVELPGGSVPLYERFKTLEMPAEFFADVKAACEKRGLVFLCSPFGLKSARALKRLAPKMIKIASPELNHFPLLEECAGYGVPLILSTGVSRMADIALALEAVEPVKHKMLLHCVTAYPAPEEEYNLKTLDFLRERTGLPCGVSDHSLDPVFIPALACAAGACAVEKHICLSKKDGGLDDPVALDAAQFSRMVDVLRECEKTDDGEIIRKLQDEFGAEKVKKALGRKRKKLAPSEKRNYGRTNRSLHYMRDIQRGEAIAPGDIAVLRTEKTLSPGISPAYLPLPENATLAKNVKNGDGVCADDFAPKLTEAEARRRGRR